MKKLILLFTLSVLLSGCNAIVKELVQSPEIQAVRLSSFSLADKQVVFDVDLYNPNPFSLPISGLNGDFKLNGLAIGSIDVSSEQQLEAHGTQTVNLPISLDTNSLIEAAKSVLTKRQALYSFNGGVDTSVGQVPFTQSGELSVQDILSSLLK